MANTSERVISLLASSDLRLEKFLKPLMETVEERTAKTNEALPNKSICERWGELIHKTWKNAPDAHNTNDFEHNDESISKADVENVIQDVFYFSIIYPKKFAQIFVWIINGLVPKVAKKKFNTMVFRCVLPFLWRNLECVNDEVRLAASRLLLKFYPLQAEDDIINEEYLQKQAVAMEAMLMDDCVPIRVEAIKKLLFHLRFRWSTFPRYIIKSYLGKVVDELSLDKADEVRAAVYEGMCHLVYCSQARVATQHALQILGNRGINDRSASVRLSAFKMLNTLIGHRYFNCFSLVELDKILLRLDFEHSEGVQRQIVRLIYKSFCPIDHRGSAVQNERFKRIVHMCKISRNAALNFHRHIYSLKLISSDLAKIHILSLVCGVKAHLKRIIEEANKDKTNDHEFLELNQTAMSNYTLDITNSSTNGTVSIQRKEKELDLIKDVLDSAIVLWTTMRCDLYQKFPELNEVIQKIMSKILDIMQFFLDPPVNIQRKEELVQNFLLDSALVVAANLPTKLISKSLQDKVLNAVLKPTGVSDLKLNGYIEAFSSWDSDRLVQIIGEGLDNLYKSLACDANGLPIRIAAPRPASAAQVHNSSPSINGAATSAGSDENSPPVKRVRRKRQASKPSLKNQRKRRQSELYTMDYPLKLIGMILASPMALANVKGRDGFHIVQFCKILIDIRRAFGIRLRMEDLQENSEEIDLMIKCYENLTLLSLISKSIEPYDDSSEESGDELDARDSTLVEPSNSIESTSNADESSTGTWICPGNAVKHECDAMSVSDRRLMSELKWMGSVMREVRPYDQVVKMFMRCVNMHLDCSELSLRTLKRTTNIIFELFHTVGMDLQEDVLQFAKHLYSAIEYCEDNDRLMIEGLITRLKVILA